MTSERRNSRQKDLFANKARSIINAQIVLTTRKLKTAPLSLKSSFSLGLKSNADVVPLMLDKLFDIWPQGLRDARKRTRLLAFTDVTLGGSDHCEIELGDNRSFKQRNETSNIGSAAY